MAPDDLRARRQGRDPLQAIGGGQAKWKKAVETLVKEAEKK